MILLTEEEEESGYKSDSKVEIKDKHYIVRKNIDNRDRSESRSRKYGAK